MKGLPPPAPPETGGEQFTGIHRPHFESPLLVKEGVGGGQIGGGLIHNQSDLKPRRKALRNESTPAEKKLWSTLQRSQLHGFKFRRQHSVGYYILDFYCPSERLAVELDGDSHFTDEAIEYDRERTNLLNSLNIRVLRFLNTDVYDNLESVCERIIEEIRNTSLPPLAPPKIGGERKPTRLESPLLVKEGVGGGQIGGGQPGRGKGRSHPS